MIELVRDFGVRCATVFCWVLPCTICYDLNTSALFYVLIEFVEGPEV
jgi:hypothetical protein